MSDTTRIERPNGRDPRIDRGVIYALGVVITLALSGVGYQFQTLSTKLDGLVSKVEGFARSLAILEAGGLEPRVRVLEDRVTRIEAAADKARGGAR